METRYKKTKLACYGGYTVQAIINNFLPILFVVFQKNFGLSYEKLGRLVLINFFVQIFADITTPFIVKKIGFKKSAVLCHFLAALGLSLLSFLPKILPSPYTAIIICVMIYAFGSGIIEVVISPIVEYLPTDNKAGNMAVLHSFYCWGQAFTVIISTVLVKVFGYGFWNFIPLVWAIIPLSNMFFFSTVSVVEPIEEENEKSNKKDFKSKKFVFLVILMICSGASEISMSQWASIFAQNGLGISKFAGDLLGPCTFAIFMGIGRILYAAFAEKIPFLKILVVCSILCTACYLVVGFVNNPVIALIGCGFCGITVSFFWPGTLSFAVKTFPQGGTFMFSFIALSGDIGCSLGPWILGITADKINLQSGFVVASVFPIVMLITALLFARENKMLKK